MEKIEHKLNGSDKSTIAWFIVWMGVKGYDLEEFRNAENEVKEKKWKKFLKSDTAICLSNNEFKACFKVFTEAAKTKDII